jgi:hypothetical protein
MTVTELAKKVCTCILIAILNYSGDDDRIIYTTNVTIK